MTNKTIVLFIGFFSLLFTACYKDNFSVNMPAKNSQVFFENNISLGSDYKNQIFYDLESAQKFKSFVEEWDLAFSTDSLQPHIKINTGKSWSAFITSQTDINATFNLNSIPYDQWKIDNPNGSLNELSLGSFVALDSNLSRVIILKKINTNGQETFFKMKIKWASHRHYIIEMKPFDRSYKTNYEIIIPQNINCNYYFSQLNNGNLDFNNQTLMPISLFQWDFVFTRYAVYFPVEKLNYIVTGVLLNPLNTSVYMDSISTFDSHTLQSINYSKLTKTQDAIGYTWKTIDNSFSEYQVKKNFVYIIKTSEGNFYKMRFLGFYNQNKEKGNPSFEYQVLK